MLSIDPRTIVLFASILAGLMALILLSMRWSLGEHVRGLLAWVMGMVAVAIASVFYALRGIWPDFLTFVLANGLFLFAACSWTAGTLRFYGRRPPWKLLAAACIGGTLLIAWYVFVEPNYGVRLVTFTAITSVLYLVQAAVVLRHGERHFVTWFFAGALLLFALTLLMRCIFGVVALPPQSHLFSADVTQIAYLLFANSMPLFLATGFFMAVSHKIQGKLSELSRLDSLTGIQNRRAFLEQFHSELARHRRHIRALSVLLLDVDHFKRINDTYGHAAGDAVLVNMCATVKKLLRKSDAFGRVGGEEFAILLPETEANSAVALAERIREGVAAAAHQNGLAVTVSIGVAALDDADEAPLDAMRRADAALYRAKAGGRNQSVMAAAG